MRGIKLDIYISFHFASQAQWVREHYCATITSTALGFQGMQAATMEENTTKHSKPTDEMDEGKVPFLELSIPNHPPRRSLWGVTSFFIIAMVAILAAVASLQGYGSMTKVIPLEGVAAGFGILLLALWIWNRSSNNGDDGALRKKRGRFYSEEKND